MVKKAKNAKGKIAQVAGQGGYYTDKILPVMQQLVPKGTFARAGGSVGAAAGTLLGASSGMSAPASAIGGGMGRYLGKGLARLVGFGDYTVTNNTLFREGMALTPGESVPMFGTMGAETRVRHREYIGDVVVPEVPLAFTNTAFIINPGDTNTFPWLASTAGNYQQYRINGMVFEFKTLSSDITAGGSLGAVILGTNYNVLDTPYTDKLHMENAQFCVSAKPSQSQIHTVECDPRQVSTQLKYVRDSTSSSSVAQDARLYDHGKFQIATVGLPGTPGTVMGELWCSYDISLYKPEIADPQSFSVKVVAAGSVSKAVSLGTSPVVTGARVTAVGNTITFARADTYIMTLLVTGTSLAAPVVSGSSTTALISAVLDGTGAALSLVYTVVAPSAGATVIYDFSTSTTVTGNAVRFSDYNVSLG